MNTLSTDQSVLLKNYDIVYFVRDHRESVCHLVWTSPWVVEIVDMKAPADFLDYKVTSLARSEYSCSEGETR